MKLNELSLIVSEMHNLRRDEGFAAHWVNLILGRDEGLAAHLANFICQGLGDTSTINAPNVTWPRG